MSTLDRISKLESQRDLMIIYMKMKIEEMDWHGVADSAMDIRDIESELKGLLYNRKQ